MKVILKRINLLSQKPRDSNRLLPQSQAETNLKCEVCNKMFNSEIILNKHMESHTTEGDWTWCDQECSFQTNTKANLEKHKRAAHYTLHGEAPQGGPKEPELGNPEVISRNTCNLCKKDFVYRIDLNKHMRDNHNNYKPCRNLQSCVYAPRCRYNHEVYPEGNQVCSECGTVSKSMHELMRHRKAKHKVPLCKNFLRNSCDFSDQDCYHSHSKKAQSEPVKVVSNNQTQNVAQNQGFQTAKSNLAPPSKGPFDPKGPTQSEWIQMKMALNKLNKIMTKFQ